MDIIYNIGCIGAGNLASHLLHALHSSGHNITQVLSRSILSAQSLAASFDADYTNELDRLDPDLDILFLTVPDQVLQNLIIDISWFRGIVVHTSGSHPLKSFECVKYPHGILYPLQTFTRNKKVDFRSIPIFIEGSDERVISVLEGISNQISDHVNLLGSEQRAYLHLAAVFTNNFTNYLLTAADDILENAGIEREVLISLIKETLDKAMQMGAASAQTGPAVRGDIITIKKHLKLLSFSPELQSIYECLSTSIQNYYSTQL